VTFTKETTVLGDVEVTRIQEYVGPGAATPGFLFPDSDAALWSGNADWLDPDFYDAGRGMLRSVLHSWLIRSEGMIVLVDTGAGNGKERPHAPAYAHHDNPYLANLEAAGVRAEEWQYAFAHGHRKFKDTLCRRHRGHMIAV